MQQNIKIINTAKTLKGSHFKTHRSHQKIDRLYTEIIYEDDYHFHNIKVRGQCVQISEHKQKEKAVSKRTQQDQQGTEDHGGSPTKKQFRDWASKTNLFISKGSAQPSSGFVRSITADTAMQFQKNQPEHKFSRKFTRTQTTINGDQYPRVTYKQQNLNEQVYCSFKTILDEFNKVKGKGRPNLDENKIITQDKSFRKTYKKPNFYNYQQFYRQNYQAKHLKQSPFLFKKCDYVPANEKMIGVQKQKVKPGQRNLVSKKTTKVYVCIDSSKMSIQSRNQLKNQNQQSFLGPSSCLSGKEHNKTQRSRYRKQALSKTHNNYTLNSSENDKIEPWKVPDQLEIWF